MLAEDTIHVASFRNGTPFIPKMPNADGYADIIDMLEGPKGRLFIMVSFHVLCRSFNDVTLKEVGEMELADLMPLVKIGMDGLNGLEGLDTMGFQDT